MEIERLRSLLDKVGTLSESDLEPNSGNPSGIGDHIVRTEPPDDGGDEPLPPVTYDIQSEMLSQAIEKISVNNYLEAAYYLICLTTFASLPANQTSYIEDLNRSIQEGLADLEPNSGLVVKNGSWSHNMNASICKRVFRELGSHTSSSQLHGLQLLNEYNRARQASGLAPIKLGDLGSYMLDKGEDSLSPNSSLFPNSAVETANTSTNAEVHAGTHEVVGFDSEVIEQTSENAQFIDSTQLSAVDTSHTDLGNFLSRPVQIQQYELNVGSALNVSFTPWGNFLRTAAVRRKIENYSLLRGKLHLRFLVNGGPTYYGKLIAAYNPFDFYTRQNNIVPQGIGFVSTGVKLTKMSQRPHVIIDPTESSGGDITCPFVFPFNYMDITTDSIDAETLGHVDIHSITPLGSASVPSGTSTDDVAVTITVFAWMTEVTLAAPTHDGTLSPNGSLVPNSGMGDEYGKGIISRPASAVARWAGKLATIPEIGPFATATSMVAGGVADLASLFGYCRPMSVEAPRQYRPTYMGNLANTDIEEAGCKLTFDAKQELTIDHNIIGRKTEDELNVLSIAKRESFVDCFNWNGTSAPGTVLAKINVTPTVMPKHTFAHDNNVITELGYTALAFASQPFTYWRGGLRYRFSVMCSSFHRGRLKITYDPQNNEAENADTNAVYTRIVDIGANRDFTLDVNWMQGAPWLLIDQPTSLSPGMEQDYTPRLCSIPVATSTSLANNRVRCNGQITIEVLNNLVSPLETETLQNNVEIAWFVSACDDYEVASPAEAFGNLQAAYTRNITTLTANSGECLEPNSGLAGASPIAQKADAGEILALEPIGQSSDFKAMSLVHFGETFDNFRKMMKRYTFYEDIPLPNRGPNVNTNQNFLFRFLNPNFPVAFGVNGNGFYTNPATSEEPEFRFNVARNSLMTYLAHGFVSRRGGVRWKYMINASPLEDSVRELRAARYPLTYGQFAPSSRIQRLNPVNADQQLTAQDLMSSATNEFGGSYITSYEQNPTAEVELPYYSNYRFQPGPDNVMDLFHWHKIETYMHNVGNVNNGILRSYVAAGEDFNLSWFINAPSLYYQGFVTGTG